jgi:Skp family chaperone for outer membrane proteins
VHHFGLYRRIARALLAGATVLFLLSVDSSAEERPRTEEIKIGVADVEQALQRYWRTPRVRADAERRRTSEEYRQKQAELDRLEREITARRFAFFRANQSDPAVREKQQELQELADAEAVQARAREKQAVEELLSDIRRAAETVGRENQYTVIFDSNTPYVLFVGAGDTGIDDVTEPVIDQLNFR